MDEVWKPIQGLEGLYEISNLGRVKSLNYRNHGYSRVLVPKENNKGYLWVELWKDGKRHCLQIHRLVGMHFIPNNNPNRTVINHIDENPKNNIVTNLEWCTIAENNLAYRLNHGWIETEKTIVHRAYRNKTTNYIRKNKDHRGIKIVQLSLGGEFIETHDDIAAIARKKHYHNTSIYECCIGKRKTAYGYKWQFANQVALA